MGWCSSYESVICKEHSYLQKFLRTYNNIVLEPSRKKAIPKKDGTDPLLLDKQNDTASHYMGHTV